MKRCSICHTKEEPGFIKHRYKINRCPNCGLLRTVLDQPYRKMINNYYTKSYFNGQKNRAGYANYENDHHIVRKNSQSYLSQIRKNKKNGKILDIGCATGIFLEEAQKQGYAVRGIDVSSYAIRRAKKRHGVKVSQGTLTQKSFAVKSFDIITMLDVFEHLHSPRLHINKCAKLLKKKGLLMINTGDSDSFLARIQKHRWHFYIPPQHVYFYSLKNLSQLLESEGLEVIFTTHQGKYLSLRYLLHLARTIDHSQLANWGYNLVYKNSFGKIPLKINLRDNMTIIAQKK